MHTVPTVRPRMQQAQGPDLLTLRARYVSLSLIGTINPGHNKEETWVFLLGLFWAS
jgi:hypothetical protein